MDTVTDCRIGRLVDYDLLLFLKDISCNDIQFKLLCFWGRHPKAKLSLYTIARTLDASAINLRDAMANLVGKGILMAQRNDNGLTTYAIADQQAREYIDELGSLDWNQAVHLGRQLKE